MILDVFRGDAYSMTALTQSILKLPFKPGRLGEMGLFQDKSVNTLTVVVEEKNGVLALLNPMPRGTQSLADYRTMRKARSFLIPHIPMDGAIMAADVMGVRAFGSENELLTVAGLVNERLMEMRSHHEVTLEYLRMGALHGVILNPDGSTLYDLFQEFGLANVPVPVGFTNGYAQATTTDASSATYNPEFGMGQAYLDIGGKGNSPTLLGLGAGQHCYTFNFSDPTYDVRGTCVSIARDMEKTLGMATYDHLHAFCGANFFDALIDHDDVRATFLNWFQAQNLRQDLRKGFDYGGIVWENYRGTVGNTVFQDPNSCTIFPVGVPQLFMTYYAPADFAETVNTPGLPIYAKQEPLPFNRGVQLHTQSNPLPLCCRPLCLIKGRAS